MRRYVIPLILAMLFVVPQEIAATSLDHDRHDRREHRYDRHDRDYHRKGDKEWAKYQKKREKDWNKYQKKREKERRKYYKHHDRRYHYHDNLGYLVSRAARGGHSTVVWQVSPDTYVVRYVKGGNYYMRYLYPNSGRYGSALRLVADGPGWWYQYGDRRRRFHEANGGLRLYLNGSPQNPWQLIPSLELNIPF